MSQAHTTFRAFPKPISSCYLFVYCLRIGEAERAVPPAGSVFNGLTIDLCTLLRLNGAFETFPPAFDRAFFVVNCGACGVGGVEWGE